MEVGKLKLHSKPTLIYPITRRILAAFESYADWENIKLSFEYKTNKDLKIELDVEQYETVLNNLLSNAFKFTNRGGKVTVMLENLGQAIRVEVQDTGRGIHPDDLPQIFDRYFQTAQTNAPAEGGTGIGLALSYEIAKLFGGDLRAESELHKGSRFIFEFPLKEVFGKLTDEESKEITSGGIVVSDLENLKSVENKELKKSANIESKEKKTILIVEDNFELRKYIKAILEGKYEILEANNGESAWNILNAQSKIPPPHLLISDLMMPIMDGYQLVQKLKTNHLFRNIPIVILTAKASSEDKLKALRIGVDDYLLKPFDEEELKARVENLLKHSDWRKAFQKESLDLPIKNREIKPVEASIELTKADEEWLSDLEKATLAKIDNFNFSVEQLAHEMATSRWQLNRRLKQLTGLTASQYLLETRLNQARTLLEEGNHDSVKAVTYSIGLKDLQNFSKKFKARFGKSPSEYL